MSATVDAAPLKDYLRTMRKRTVAGAQKNAATNLFQEDFHFERLA